MLPQYAITGVKDALVYTLFLPRDGLKVELWKSHRLHLLFYNMKILDMVDVTISSRREN